MRPFYRASDYSMKNSVGYLIRRTSNLVLPQLEALFADASLTFSQWTVLMALREWGNSTSVQIARDICHDAGSLTRILDELEERGLISRVRNETDRRSVTVSLTSQGLALVESLLPRVVAHWNTLLVDFNHTEIKLLVKLMTRLTYAAAGKRDQQDPRKRADRAVGAERASRRQKRGLRA
jgi:DNA-binding MarR family transcriptional regulator